jgi:hypothetical protein
MTTEFFLNFLAFGFAFALLANGYFSALSLYKDYNRRKALGQLIDAASQAQTAANLLNDLAASSRPLCDLLREASNSELRAIENAIASLERNTTFLRKTKDENLASAFEGTGLSTSKGGGFGSKQQAKPDNSNNNKQQSKSSDNNSSNSNATNLSKFAAKLTNNNLDEARNLLSKYGITEQEFETDGHKRGEAYNKANAEKKS